jgi:predicted MFS family arabinose efflux permease
VTEPHRPARPTRLVTPSFLILVAAALAFFTGGGVVLPVASRFADGPLGADTTGVGIGIGAFAVGALLMRPVVGWASDRFGRRPMLVGGSLLTIVALGLHIVADTLPMFVIARAVLGVAEGFFLVSALAAASDLAPSNRGGEAINLASLSLYIGLALGPPIGETVLARAGFDAAWIAAGALTVVATILSLLVPETAPAVLARSRGEAPGRRARLFHPAGLFPGLLILTGAWGMAGFFAFVPLHATEIGMDGAALPLAIYAVVVIVLRLFFAKLPDQIGAARLSGVALAVGTTGLAIMGAISNPLGLIVGSAVFAAGVAFIFPALLSVAVSRVHETERGSVVGTTSVFLDLSFGLAPAVLGTVAASVGFSGAFLVSAGVAAFGTALLVARRATLVRQSAPTR